MLVDEPQYRIERFDRLSKDLAADLGELVARVKAADGADPFDEAAMVALAGRGATRPDDRFVALVAREPAKQPVGYAQLVRAGKEAAWSLALVVDPAWRNGSPRLGNDLLQAARREAGGPVALWVGSGRSWSERLALGEGWQSHRSLYRMQRPLPVQERSHLAVRAFRVGEDEDAWLAVNNRAFAGHPEQGGWSREDLEAHEAYDWFDPEGFLVYETGGQLQGFCWTKLHRGSDPLIGEIYVIATDPSAAGHGLGRRLVLAGLCHLADKGAQVGVLYTEADNVAAVRLYVSLGFVVESVRRLYSSGD